MADNLSCPLCYELFTNVVETPCCSQGFCLSCLDSALKATRQTCPNCRKPLSIFSCVPNKMVQRMVDNTPAECIYPGCTAKITRGIKKDHIEKCPNKPKVVGSPCPTHNLPLAFVCEEDKEAICSLCNIVGKHRTHKMGIRTEGENSIFLKGIQNIGVLSVETDMETNLASFPYILANGIADVGILDKLVNHDVKVSNSNSNGGKDEMRALSPILREHKLVSTAAFMLLLKNASLTASNIHNMLQLAGIHSLSDSQYPKLLETHETKVKQWLKMSEEETKSEKFNKLVNEAIDEQAAEKEFEKLKEKYHNEQFNFQGVQIKALPLCSKLLPNVPNHVYVLLEIRVGKKEERKEEKRPPFSLSIVLDRSGSMAGAKIEMAKDAIKSLVDKLEPEDRFHLIQYDDRSDIVFTDGNIYEKERLKDLISKCRSEGGTNISGGLQTGFDVVMKSSIPTKKIFLFSDGQAGSGITSKPEMNKFVQGLWERGVGISTFGIGSDYDELMMKGIAENSKGHYFYVDSPHTIGKLLDKAFKGLARTVASNVVLKVKGGKGRVVTKVKESSNKEMEDLFKGIALGDMREKDLKQVLVQIEVNEKESADPIEVLSFELSYEKLDDCVQDSPVSGSVTLTTTTNLDELTTFNDDTQVYLTIHECGELDKKVLKFLEQNLLESAIETKLEVIDALNGVVSKDKVGFVKVLLMKAKRSLKDLVNLFVSRNRAQASSYGMVASGSAKSYDHIKKEQHKAMEDEDEADMGYALFD